MLKTAGPFLALAGRGTGAVIEPAVASNRCDLLTALRAVGPRAGSGLFSQELFSYSLRESSRYISIGMRLWTWQKQGFHIADKSRQVESLENSIFLNDGIDSEQFRQVYAKLYKKLGTSQFHWYFTTENEAKNRASHLQWFDRGCELWEVNVPVERILRKVCTIAWTHLLNRPAFPSRLRADWVRISCYDDVQVEEWKRNFHEFWNKKPEDELWDMLFMETHVEGCTDILIRHPLDDSWIVRDPTKEGKWWEMYKGNAYGPRLYDCPLPCVGCVARGSSQNLPE